MSKLCIPQILCKSILILGLCYSASVQAAKEKVVAVVGSKSITLSEFNQRFNDLKKQTMNPPSREVFLEDLVRYELGLQEAKSKKLDEDPAVREKLNQQLYKALIERALAEKISKIKVTENEMKSFHKKFPEIRTSHILIEFKPTATAKQISIAKARANEIYSEVKNSKRPFEDLVKLYTDDPVSKKKEGDIGWQNKLTLVPEYYDIASKLKVGAMSKVVRTRFGFHIIKLTGIRPYEDSNKRSIRAAVFDIKRKEIFDSYFMNIKKKYEISINKGALKQ